MKPLLAALLAAASLAVWVGTSSAQTAPGCRILKVTSHNDATNAKNVDSFFVCPDDRVYITRKEADVIHTADGSVAGVDFAAGYTFGNAALTRVPR